MIFEKKEGKLKGDFGKLKDGKYRCSELKETRSLKLNNYYWFCIDYIIQEYKNYGYLHTNDILHKQFKKCFLPRKRVKSDFSKSYIYVLGSTATLNSKQMSKYITNIKLICEFAKLGEIENLEEIGGFLIPDPEDRELLNYIDKIIKNDNTGKK